MVHAVSKHLIDAGVCFFKEKKQQLIFHGNPGYIYSVEEDDQTAADSRQIPRDMPEPVNLHGQYTSAQLLRYDKLISLPLKEPLCPVMHSFHFINADDCQLADDRFDSSPSSRAFLSRLPFCSFFIVQL